VRPIARAAAKTALYFTETQPEVFVQGFPIEGV